MADPDRMDVRPGMAIHLQFDRIAPGAQVGPHRHAVETIVYLAAGEISFEHGLGLSRRVLVRAGDVLYKAPFDEHLVRNDGAIDALALTATVDLDPERPFDDQPSWRTRPGEPVRRRERARVIAAPGLRHRVLVEPGDFGTQSFSVAEVELDPGAATGWHRHLASEHVVVVLEGRGTVRIGSLEETLEPLKGVWVEMGLPHAIANTGRTRLRYFLCATPAADPLTDRENLDPPT
jgi:quercetin dioxygenase-like cupin family protein